MATQVWDPNKKLVQDVGTVAPAITPPVTPLLRGGTSGDTMTSTKSMTDAVKKYAGAELPATSTLPAVPATTATATPAQPTGSPLTITPAVSSLEQGVSEAQNQLDTEKQKQMESNYYDQVIKPFNDAVSAGLLPKTATPPAATYKESLAIKLKASNDAIASQSEQLRIASQLDKNALDRTKAQGTAAIAGTTAAMAQSREGVIGSSAPLVSTSFAKETQAVIDDAALRLQAAESNRSNIAAQLQQAQQSNNQGVADSLSAALTSADNQVRQAKLDAQTANQNATEQSLKNISTLASTGILEGADTATLQGYATQYGIPIGQLQALQKIAVAKTASAAQKIAAEQMTNSIDMFTKMNVAGVPITSDIIQSTAVATGVQPAFLQAAAAGYNQTVKAIQDNKNLDPLMKSVELQNAQSKLEDQLNGYTTTAGQNIKALANLYKSGASADIIASFKQGAGITDYSDPLTLASLASKQAQATIDMAHASGRAVTPDDIIKKATTQAELAGLGYTMTTSGQIVPLTSDTADGTTTAYVPNSPIEGFKVEYKDGIMDITTPAREGGWQCGAGVNRVWGLASGSANGMGNTIASKMALVDKNGIKSEDITNPSSQIIPGMAFVMTMAGTKYADTGHTGLVKQNLGDGNVLTAEWNADGKGGYSEQIRNINQLYGFANPPSGKADKKLATGETAISTPMTLPALQSLGLEVLNNGIDNGSIDLGKMPVKVLEQAQKILGADRVKEIQGGNKRIMESDIDSLAKGLASYNIDPKDLSARLPTGSTESERVRVLKKALEINPDYSAGNYAAKKSVIDSWSGAPTPNTYAFMNNSANTAIKHLGTLKKAFDKMKNSGMPDSNSVFNWMKDHTGESSVSAFESIVEPLSGEMAKAVKGATTNKDEIDAYRIIFNPSKSPAQMEKAIEAQVELMAGRVKTNINKYKKDIGTLPKDSILDDESIEVLKSFKLNPSEFDPTLSQEANQSNTKVNPENEAKMKTIKEKISFDLQAGHQAQDIINAMLQSEYAKDVQDDLDSGYTPEELVQLYAQ